MGRARQKKRRQQAAVAQRAVPRNPATPSLARKIAIRLAGVLFGLVAGVLLTELGLRMLGIAPERYEESRWYVWEGDQYLPAEADKCAIRQASPLGIAMGEYVPGSKLKQVFASNPRGHLDADNGVEYSINALGLRGPEIAFEKPAETFRILGLGDSITFGIGVRDDETYLRRIEKALNAEYHDHPRFEVLNSGVQGYNTRDEVIALEGRWIQLHPDLVVIFFYLNDAYNDIAIKNMGEDLGVHNEPTPLARFSRVYDLIQHNRQTRAIRRRVEEIYAQKFFTDAEHVLPQMRSRDVDWRISRAALAHAAELARKQGFKLALVILPELYKLDGNYPFDAVHRLVSATGQELGIPTLDLLETLRGRDAAKLWVHPADHHPNRDAHALVAAAVEEFLKRENLLPPPTPPTP
jgi:lysophospholipase L1-like esterase